jgi:hypothetical protein
MKISALSPITFLICLWLVSCTPEATPFPVDIPTISSTSAPNSQSTLRYALAANTENLVSDLAVIQAEAQIEQLTAPINNDDLGSHYDLATAYGDLEGGTRSPIVNHIALVLNPSIAPLDNKILINILRRSLDTKAIVTALDISGVEANAFDPLSPLMLRTELANAGWPDGLKLILAYAYTPGAATVAEHLGLAGIQAQLLALTEQEVITAFTVGRIQAGLISWKTAEERENWVSKFGDENVLDLYSVPISYIAVSGLDVEFTPSGWPIPAR